MSYKYDIFPKMKKNNLSKKPIVAYNPLEFFYFHFQLTVVPLCMWRIPKQYTQPPR